MARRRLIGALGAAALAGLAASCAPAADPPPPMAGGLALRFEDVLAPEVFVRAGRAVAEGPEGAAGLWAVAPGLPRPERGRIERLDTGARVEVALFAGAGGPDGAIRVSAEAAAALGIAGGAVPVRVTALRREPRLAPP
jgi:hypothetical protein